MEGQSVDRLEIAAFSSFRMSAALSIEILLRRYSITRKAPLNDCWLLPSKEAHATPFLIPQVRVNPNRTLLCAQAFLTSRIAVKYDLNVAIAGSPKYVLIELLSLSFF
jgi:hypothetical protein